MPRKAPRSPPSGRKSPKTQPGPDPGAATGYETGASEYGTKGGGAEPARLHGKPFHCLACKGSLFYTRESLLNTVGLTILDWEAFNREATNLICHDCGYIHWFTIPR